MNPVSPMTFYLRHKKGALVQIALISLVTVGLFILVAVLDAIPQRANVSYMTKLSRVVPIGNTLDPAMVAQLRGHPDIAHVIPDNGLRISLPTLLGTDSQQMFGVSIQDAQVLMQHCGVRLKAGRMFEPRSNEFILSEEVARALDLELGSEIGRGINKHFYEAVPAPLVLVGILEGDIRINAGSSVRLGFISSEYLNSHELYAPRSTSLLVIAKEGHKTEVDTFLETDVRSSYTEVETFTQLVEFLKMTRFGVYVIFGVVNSIASISIAFVIGVINRIAMSKRLSEFGLLHALGRTKKMLVRRLTFETTAVACLGCLLGLGGALILMAQIKNGYFYNLGMELDLANPAPFCFVMPIPLVVVALTFLNSQRVFNRLDAVSIIERGKLSEEVIKQQTAKRSSSKPLSSITFYIRHRRRGVLMIVGTALMLLSITLPVFLLSATMSAISPYIGYLEYVSVVSPIHTELDPGIVGEIRGHPAVERIIPAVSLGIRMVMPLGAGTDVRIYGVSEADLVDLLTLFGMKVKEGRLPQPRSNEIVLSAAVAANRALQVGDIIGGDNEDEGVFVVDDIPTEMVVVGILSPDHPWIGFASYEYLNSHELTAPRSPRLLVIPREGQKHSMDRCLERGVDTTLARVVTYDARKREDEKMMGSLVLTFVLLECMITAVASIALATLNHIFFNERREEFGILAAVGHSRWRLVLRTVKETSSVVSVAWVVGAMLCMTGLVGLQNLVYGPRGLTLNFFDAAPWLLTLPIPLAVILASVATIAWMLHKLDPVAVIERR